MKADQQRAMSQKTRQEYEQELIYRIARHGDAIERERAAKEERMRAHELLVELLQEVLDLGFRVTP